MKIAFAGLRHDHIFVLYEMAKNNPLYEIVGAYESHEESVQKAIGRGVDVCYKTYDALLADPEVEVVAIGSCFSERGEMAIKALESGKHVICDKPLCTSAVELKKIDMIAKINSLSVSCMYTMRYEDKVTSVRELLRSGALGEINNVYFGGQHPLQYGRRPAWYYERTESGESKHGGVINDIAIHGIDLLSFLFDGKIAQIHGARCWNKYATEQPEFKDCGQLMISLENGAGVIADVSYAIPDGVEFALPYYWQFYIWGTNGCIQFALGNDEPIKYYVKGELEPKTLEIKKAPVDYLTDFYDLVSGREGVVLPMADVFESTRATLMIQEYSFDQGVLKLNLNGSEQ